MRIDANSTGERQQLKDEIRSDLRREDSRRRLLGCGCSLFLVLALAIAPVLFIAAQLAKTGFVDVPVFSSRSFHATTPSRDVQPLVGSSSDAITKVIVSRAKFDEATSRATLRITEQELTTLISDALAGAPKNVMPFTVSRAQVAVDAGAVELFVVSPQKNRETTVKARFIPVVRDGHFHADVERIEVGSYVVPKLLGELAFTAFGSYALTAVQNTISRIGTLTAITLEDKALTFVIHVAKP